MRHIVWCSTFLFLLPVATKAQTANSATNGGGVVTPAVTASRVRCSGFISKRIPADIEVFDGSDNDLFEVFQQFTPGQYVYLRSRHGAQIRVGDRFTLLRRDIAPIGQVAWMPDYLQDEIEPPQSLYFIQRYRVRELGEPYVNTGTVQVTSVTNQGAVAKISDVCGTVNIGDIAVPYHPVSVPAFRPNPNFRRFGEPNGKLEGNIVAASHATNYLALGDICYLDMGANKMVRVGQVFQAYEKFRDNIVEGGKGILPRPKTPREYVGEVLILSVQQKSSVGLVVRVVREITVGDGVELE